MKDLTHTFKIATSIVFFIAILVACERDEVTASESKKAKLDRNDRVLQEIFALGYGEEDVTDCGDHYAVQDDMMFFKNGEYSITGESSSGRTGQAHQNLFIAYNKQKTVSIRVDNSIPSSGVDNWRDEVIHAIINWNKANSRIRIEYTTLSTANITIKSDNGILANNVIARGALPSNGNPGSEIIINLDFNNNMTVSSATKEYNMVHEIGHNLGLRHTNWRAFGESTATGIPGTPNDGTNPDPASVMNGGTALSTWADFSNFDINGIRRMYPEDNNSNRAYDPVYYLFSYADMSAAYSNNPAGAESHWVTTGISEGRIANVLFDVDYYRSQYSDLSGMTRLQATTHWVTDGSNEGRIASIAFDVHYYLQNNPDLLATYGAAGFQKAISHYITTGIDEGRMACPIFNPVVYLQNNPDVAAAYGSTNYRKALYHWVAWGRNEGRTAI